MTDQHETGSIVAFDDLDHTAHAHEFVGAEHYAVASEVLQAVLPFGSADEQVAAARSSPHWPGLEALAHTLAYDGALYGPPPVTRLTTLAQSTLVASGGASGFFEASADVVAASIPKAERTTMAGQGHVVDPGTMAAVLRRFFG